MSFVRDAAWFSRTGTRHGDMNQDTGVVDFLTDSTGAIVAWVGAVFDGHGILGETAAASAANALRQCCLASPPKDKHDFRLDVRSLQKEPQAMMNKLFQVLQDAVVQAHTRPPSEVEYSDGDGVMQLKLTRRGSKLFYCTGNERFPVDFGCTAVVAVVLQASRLLIVGNAGDASAFVCESAPGQGLPHDLRLNLVSRKHNPSNPQEQQRVARQCGRKVEFLEDGYMSPRRGDMAATMINLTRSLGHVRLQQYGMSYQPDIHVETLTDAAVAVLLCSDGITDDLTGTDIAGAVHSADNAHNVGERLAELAHQRCQSPSDIDDCTVALLSFQRKRTRVSCL
eukprot:m.121699 g.121699  ORF g.121699 m.121699 type:complete len:339 (+) comp19635_c0_seq5:34-1050(+)